MNIRTWLCFALSRRLMQPASTRSVDYTAYGDWRHDSLSRSWSAFDDSNVSNLEVLDFGCGDGQLSLFLAREKNPRRIVGVDINEEAIARAKDALQKAKDLSRVNVQFTSGSPTSIPLPDMSVDVVLAFDCLEHVMSPAPILREWLRVLRPGGRCLIEWFPYKGPWGPHMESLIPIPWAHVLFGERAMFRTAEMIYELPEFEPRYWDLDADGNKKPNKWKAWSSFAEQGYINQLDTARFRHMAADAGFEIVRFDQRSFTGSRVREFLGRTAMKIPLIGQYFVSSTAIVLERTRDRVVDFG